MLKPFYHEQAVTIDGETLRLVINFAAIDATEHLLGKPFPAVLEAFSQPVQPLGVLGKVVWGLLREHHPEVSLDQAASLLFGENGLRVGAAVSLLLNAAFPAAEEGKAKAKNPRKPRGASKPS